MGVLARLTRFLTGTSSGAQAAPADRCKHGHEFTDATTYWRPDGRGRECRICRREASRRRASRSTKPVYGPDSQEG